MIAAENETARTEYERIMTETWIVSTVGACRAGTRVSCPSLGNASALANSPNEYHYLVRYISGKVAGEEEAEGLTEEVCAWIEKKLSRDYSWPGNFRELEQCVRNILIHREYYPQNKITEDARDNEDLAAQLEAGDLTAEELIQQYATRIYGRTQNYGR